jgi:hypothetical protein
MRARRGLEFHSQVLDGPPGVAIRRPSTFLLIPVGYHRQGFAFCSLRKPLACEITDLHAC